MTRHICSAVLAMVVGWLPALAQQTTGGIEGTATDPDGRVAVGVTVSVRNADTGLKRTTVSNLEGRYRLVELPPGEYELTASLPGFQTSRHQPRVPPGGNTAVDIEMSLGAFAGAIEVRGSEVQRGVNATDLNVRVPLVSDATQVALLTPGVVPGDAQYDPVSHEFPPAICGPAWTTELIGWGMPGQQIMAMGGASVAESAYQVDGLNITNFSSGLGSSFIPIEFVDQIRVETGGLRADTGGALGGVVNMVTKRGGNLLTGSFSTYWRPEALQEQEPDTVWALNQREEREGFEMNASLGGPIVPDRLFFFLFGRYVEGSSLSLYGGWGIRHQVSDPYWGTRLDWNVAPNHDLGATWFLDETEIDKVRFNYDAATGTESDPFPGTSHRGGQNMTVRYTGVLRDNFLLSAQAGVNQFDRTNRSESDDCPYAVEAEYLGGGYWDLAPIGCWAHPYILSWRDTRQAFRVDSDWLVGRHGIRVGAGLEAVTPDAVETLSGGVGYAYYPARGLDYPDVPQDTWLVQIDRMSSAGDYENGVTSAYVQDSWAASGRVTLDLGVRWERFDHRNAVGGRLLDVNDAVAPRLAVLWDPAGSGRTAVFASAGLYHVPVPAVVNYHFGYRFDHDVAVHVLDGEILPDGSPSEVGEELFYTVVGDGQPSDPKTLAARSIDPIAQSELTLGFNRMIGRSWSIGFRGIARRLEETVEDFSINQGLLQAYGIDVPWQLQMRMGNPGRSFNGFYDLDGDGTLEPIWIPAEAMGYPRPERSYYAVEVRVDRRYAGRWALHGSYTWSHLYGNYEGLVNSDLEDFIATTWAAHSWTYDFPEMLDYAYGDLPNDHRHVLKLFGSYATPWGLQVGWNAFYSTGRPVNSFGLHPMDPYCGAYLWAGAFYTNNEPMPRGCCGRTEDVWALDLLLRYDFKLAGIDWWLRADAFNVLNNSAVTEIDQLGETWYSVPNENYGQPLFHQAPRTVRLGFGLTF